MWCFHKWYVYYHKVDNCILTMPDISFANKIIPLYTEIKWAGRGTQILLW